MKKRQKLEEGEKMRNEGNAGQPQKLLDLSEFKKLHSLKVGSQPELPQGNLQVIVDDDNMENEEDQAEDEEGVDPAVVSYIREQSENQARSKEDLMKKLAEKKRALLLKQYGATDNKPE